MSHTADVQLGDRHGWSREQSLSGVIIMLTPYVWLSGCSKAWHAVKHVSQSRGVSSRPILTWSSRGSSLVETAGQKSS